jgi:hypothetical protein
MAFNLWRVHPRLFTKHLFTQGQPQAQVIQTGPAAHPRDG